jgi:hypothetical protein
MDTGVGAFIAAKEFSGPVGQHLVHIHVLRCARARPEDINDELVPVTTGDHLIGSFDNGFCDILGKSARLPLG